MRVIQKALTFDDVLLLPAHSRVLPGSAAEQNSSPAGWFNPPLPMAPPLPGVTKSSMKAPLVPS